MCPTDFDWIFCSLHSIEYLPNTIRPDIPVLFITIRWNQLNIVGNVLRWPDRKDCVATSYNLLPEQWTEN